MKKINFIVGPLLFLVVFLLPLEGLSEAGHAILASTAWIAYWWITETVELPVTALLPIVLFPLAGGLPVSETTSAYGHPYIYLFLGGFIVGLAIEKWDLHRRIAFFIIDLVGTGEKKIILGFMIATGFLSMWISNTAAAIMMLPIGVSVIAHFQNRQPFSKNLMLGIAYAASIGGVATLIGTPPNIILAGIVKESLDIEISFLDWMLFATPLSVLLLLAAWIWLSRYKISEHQPVISYQAERREKMSSAEIRVAIVFSLVAFLWITRSFIWSKLIPGLDDTMIAIIGALLMFIVPAGKGNGNLMDWKTAKKLPWDVLLIFGAGLAIARGFSQTDLTSWLAGHFSELSFLPIYVLILLIITSMNFLTEITSNTATASMLLPILVTLSLSLHMDTVSLLAGAAIAASCAFMLPVATPPNAIVFGAGGIRIKDMMRAGLVLNLVSIILIFLFTQYYWGLIF